MNLEQFQNFQMLKTFVYYDEPLTFSCLVQKDLFLAYAWGDGNYVFFKTNNALLKKLISNKISIRDFIQLSSESIDAYIVNFKNGKAMRVDIIRFKELEKFCPEQGIFLQENN